MKNGDLLDVQKVECSSSPFEVSDSGRPLLTFSLFGGSVVFRMAMFQELGYLLCRKRHTPTHTNGIETK
ncbi:MAG: hypothetical protein ACI97A_003302 [Planctomycetota bacterium]|jgi:hypothetical protein